VRVLQKLIRLARKSPREQLQAVRTSVRYRFVESRWRVPRLGDDGTAYIVELFDMRRSYISERQVALHGFIKKTRTTADEDLGSVQREAAIVGRGVTIELV
jgi:phage-related protein